jgi:DNA-binding NarL/FixJ family response regulator
MTKHRLLLAEDHAILREGLKYLFSGEPDLEVVGEAEDGHKAVQQANALNPDLILMDLSMPRMNGTEAIAAIKKRHPEIKVLALTVHKVEEYVRAALDAGADGYVLKDDSRQELLTAIRSVLAGKGYLSPGVCTNVVTGYLGRGAPSTNKKPNTASLPWDTLTEREREVIKLVAEGFKNREIAEMLSVSIKTVEKHRSNLMKKLDLHNASALTSYAIANNLVVH